jgi:prophage antirepressor-like protein
MDNAQLEVFKYNNNTVRSVLINHKPWFVAKDICDVLDISNSRNALSNIPVLMKNTLVGKANLVGLNSSQKINQLAIVSEAGLYKLVFRSRKPKAEKFGAWLALEVLPDIRESESKKIMQKKISPMLTRFKFNSQNNSVLGYWSMLNKMTELFALPLEANGLTLPKNVLPHISTGRMFCDYLKKHGVDPDKIVRKYTQVYLDGTFVENVNQYPDLYYPIFTNWLENIWIKKKCAKYLITKMGDNCLPALLSTFPDQNITIPKKYLIKMEQKLLPQK